jgi:hypothetical protein
MRNCCAFCTAVGRRCWSPPSRRDPCAGRARPAAPAHGEAAQQLVAQRLGLRDGAQPAVGDLLGVQLHGVGRELEALLDDRGQLADAAALLACGAGRGADSGRGRASAPGGARRLLGWLPVQQRQRLPWLLRSAPLPPMRIGGPASAPGWSGGGRCVNSGGRRRRLPIPRRHAATQLPRLSAASGTPVGLTAGAAAAAEPAAARPPCGAGRRRRTGFDAARAPCPPCPSVSRATDRSPSTFCVRVARMMISVRMGVWRTSTPL